MPKLKVGWLWGVAKMHPRVGPCGLVLPPYLPVLWTFHLPNTNRVSSQNKAPNLQDGQIVLKARWLKKYSRQLG